MPFIKYGDIPVISRVPEVWQIEGKLREARLRVGKSRYRILYYFDKHRTAILLHGFTKNTAAVEEADKKIGRTRMESHDQRRNDNGRQVQAAKTTRQGEQT